MADTVMRYQIADYLNLKNGTTDKWVLMGAGFNTLDENPNAQTEAKTYINEKAQSSQVKSYQPQFPFDTDVIADEEAVMALYDVGRNQKVGADAQFEYVRVELFKTATSGAYPARKFVVSVECSSVSGAGGEVVKATGNLNVVGDFVDGTFNPSTKTFTASTKS